MIMDTFLSFLKQSNYLFSGFDFTFLVDEGELVGMSSTMGSFGVLGVGALRVISGLFNDRLLALLDQPHRHSFIMTGEILHRSRLLQFRHIYYLSTSALELPVLPPLH